MRKEMGNDYHFKSINSVGSFDRLMYRSNRSFNKYITEDAASVCTWYLKVHTHTDEFRMPETPSVDLCHDLACLVHAPRHVT